MKQVLLRPLWQTGQKDCLWKTAYPWTFQKWRESARRIGIALDSWDEMPLDKADCVWLLDLPDTKNEFLNIRKRIRENVPIVLQVIESPVARTRNFIEENQRLCDYVVTYQHHLPERENYFKYRLPHSLGGVHGKHMPLEQKRCALMVNSNRVEGWLAPRQSGLVGLPGIGRNLSGWKMPLWSWFNPAKGELYSWRRSLARIAETLSDDTLDIIGPGWNGEKISWNPMIQRKPYRRLIANGTDSKLDVVANYKFCIAVENYRGTHDYISEKIIDPIVAGAVPVYLGEENITETVPENAFVDVRKFPNQRELLKYLSSCPKHEWEKMFRAGQEFLKSESARSFSTERFIQNMNGIIQQILGMPSVQRIDTEKPQKSHPV